MINLVPNIYRKKIINDYKKRRLLSFFVALVGLWLSALVLLGVILISLFWFKMDLEKLVGDQVDLADYENKLEEIEKMAERADVVLKNEAINWPARAVWSLIGEIPSGIELEVIEFDATGLEPKLELSGLFATREIFQTWSATWRQKPGVAKVDVPLSSLIKDTDGNFKLIITLEEEVPSTFKP